MPGKRERRRRSKADGSATAAPDAAAAGDDLERQPSLETVAVVDETQFTLTEDDTPEVLDVMVVMARRDELLGASFAGGTDEPVAGNDPGLYINRIVAGSPAAARLRVGDCLLAVNSDSLEGLTHAEACAAIGQAKQTGSLLFTVQRAPRVEAAFNNSDWTGTSGARHSAFPEQPSLRSLGAGEYHNVRPSDPVVDPAASPLERMFSKPRVSSGSAAADFEPPAEPTPAAPTPAAPTPAAAPTTAAARVVEHEFEPRGSSSSITLNGTNMGGPSPPLSAHPSTHSRGNRKRASGSGLRFPAVPFYAKALFDWQGTAPDELSFRRGDVLLVTSVADPHNWEARLLAEDSAGTIPSQARYEQHLRQSPLWAELEALAEDMNRQQRALERNAPSPPGEDGNSSAAARQVTPQSLVHSYLVVEQRLGVDTPPRPLAIVGPEAGLFTQMLIHELTSIQFTFAVPHTTRPPHEDEQDGIDYHFVTREDMERGLKNNLFVEAGHFRDHLYGMSIDSIRQPALQGQVVIITAQLKATARLQAFADIHPLVIFLKPHSKADLLAAHRKLQRIEAQAGEEVSRDWDDRALAELMQACRQTELSHGHLFSHVLETGPDPTATVEHLAHLVSSEFMADFWVPAPIGLPPTALIKPSRTSTSAVPAADPNNNNTNNNNSNNNRNTQQQQHQFPHVDDYEQDEDEPEAYHVVLKRGVRGLGLEVVPDGPSDDARGVRIAAVTPGGAADVHGNVRVGDRILACNGVPLVNATQEQACAILTEGNTVDLVLQPSSEPLPRFSSQGARRRTVTITREQGGLGFGTAKVPGSTLLRVTRVPQDGAAARQNGPSALQPGDLIMAVNGQSLARDPRDALHALNNAPRVTLLVDSDEASAAAAGRQPQSAAQESVKPRGRSSLVEDQPVPAQSAATTPRRSTLNASDPPPSADRPLHGRRQVHLRRSPQHGLGLRLRSRNDHQVRVAAVHAGGPADRSGLVALGDRIVSVNGLECSADMSHDDILELLSTCGETVDLVVEEDLGARAAIQRRRRARSGQRSSSVLTDSGVAAAAPAPTTPAKPTVETAEPAPAADTNNQTNSNKRQARSSAGGLFGRRKRSSEAGETDAAEAAGASRSSVDVSRRTRRAKLVRDGKSGLGLKITHDREGHTRVLSLLSGGPAENAGLRVGDDILEVNGEWVVGLPHDDVVAILRERPQVVLLLAESTVPLPDFQRLSSRDAKAAAAEAVVGAPVAVAATASGKRGSSSGARLMEVHGEGQAFVTLNRGEHSFGFQLKHPSASDPNIRVSKIAPGGVAETSNRVHVGDILLSVGGLLLNNPDPEVNYKTAIDQLRSATVVKMLIQKDPTWVDDRVGPQPQPMSTFAR